MNRCLVFFIFILTSCAAFPKPEMASKTPPKPGPAVVAKVACEPRNRKPTAVSALFLVESFRCTMQLSANLNAGIRVYSSLEGTENSLVYGPERMDSPPLANDSFLYNGVTVLLAGTASGTQYSFQHPKIALQITVPRSSVDTAVFAATFSEESGATALKGLCTRVSQVTY